MNTVASGLWHGNAVRIKTASTFLGDRSSAEIQAARKELIRRLQASPEGSIVPLDLTDLEVTGSCLAELLSEPLLLIGRGRYPGRYVIGLDPTGRNTYDADAALRRESDEQRAKLIMVWQGVGGEVQLVGSVDPQVERTYDFVSDRTSTGGATARDLAEADEISIQAASNRLTKVAKLGVIHAADRINVSGGGTQFVYMAVE